MIDPAEKLKKLPPYIFGVIDKLKKEVYTKNLDVIDLAMGNPDLPPPLPVIQRLCDTVINHPRTHRYPQAKGMPKLRKAISDWYLKKFNISLNYENEVLVLIGSKEGIAHLCLSYLNPGDLAIVPDPGYPVYYNGVVLCNGQPYRMKLSPEKNYLPDLKSVPSSVFEKAKIMFINYPNNPTAAVVEDKSFFEELVWYAKKYNFIVCHDFAYSEIAFDGYKPPSFLEIPGSKDVGVEFHSFSKTFNMAGWRLGFVVGNADILSPLEKTKSYLDYGVFTPIQLSGVAALTMPECAQHVQWTVNEYKKRRDMFVTGLNKIGWEVEKSKATMYLWARIPEKFRSLSSLEFAQQLIRRTGIAVSPGSGFGENGEGYVRIALTTFYARFHDALLRIKKFLKEGPQE